MPPQFIFVNHVIHHISHGKYREKNRTVHSSNNTATPSVTLRVPALSRRDPLPIILPDLPPFVKAFPNLRGKVMRFFQKFSFMSSILREFLLYYRKEQHKTGDS